MQVVRWKLTPDQLGSVTTRYNTTTHTVQFTPDGGTTWVDSPCLDPRSDAIYRAPALAGDDARCNAAARMTAELRAAVDTAIAFDNSVRLSSELFALIALAVPGLGTIITIVTLIADVLLALGAAAIEGSFTDAVYDDILCVFYANIGTDGQMSDAQLTTILADIASGFDANVQAVFGAVSSAHGAVGWSNAGVRGTATGDCNDCGAWCLEWLPDDGGEWTHHILAGGLSTYAGGKFVGGSSGGSPSTGGCFLDVTIPITGTVTHFEIDYEYNRTDTSGVTNTIQLLQNGSVLITAGNLPTGGHTAQHLHADGTWTNKTMGIQAGVNNSNGSINVTHILMRGTGTPPALGSACP